MVRIEAMGLAILPGRLKTELKQIEDYLKNKIEFPDSLTKHKEWIQEIKKSGNINIIQQYLLEEVAKIFEKVIEHSGVFKLDKKGMHAMHQFILSVTKNTSAV